MTTLTLVDTSVLCELLQVPGKCDQDRFPLLIDPRLAKLLRGGAPHLSDAAWRAGRPRNVRRILGLSTRVVAGRSVIAHPCPSG